MDFAHIDEIEGEVSEATQSNPKYYRNPVRTGIRFVGQDVMLKATVWGLCKVSVHGRDLLDAVKEPFIAISNHSSHLDASLILGSLPQRLSRHVATGAAADYFFDKKLKGLATSLFFNAYPVDRKGAKTHKGLTGRLLDEGIPLLIFPEGTRSRTGAMSPFKPGVAALSIAKSVPCIPFALVGAFAAWPYTRPLPPTNHPEVHVVIGHPLTALKSESPEEFAARMQNVITELYNSTARAYGMPTLDDFARKAALAEAEEEGMAEVGAESSEAAVPGPSEAAAQETSAPEPEVIAPDGTPGSDSYPSEPSEPESSPEPKTSKGAALLSRLKPHKKKAKEE
ncbi:MAG: 1-acyl-sn-glycerol-3-phosphate acyltransferase [Propionibacteriaceae bacterium]|jgi:1-acyl-sn-glycerol-3-phosphate acyltransferase|nr:1-acyl-sn-glycerol-3-phosphate acyltransferase [Propionibacteriaceae bacterium]